MTADEQDPFTEWGAEISQAPNERRWQMEIRLDQLRWDARHQREGQDDVVAFLLIASAGAIVFGALMPHGAILGLGIGSQLMLWLHKWLDWQRSALSRRHTQRYNDWLDEHG